MDASSDKEVEAIADGDFLPATPTTAKQDEASADNIPAPALQKKIKKLEAKIKQGKVNKEAKAQARLDRMKERLEFRKGQIATRNQSTKGAKKMKVTDKQLQEMIIEETKIVLMEDVARESADLSTADSVLSYLNKNNTWKSWGPVNQDRLQVATRIYATMIQTFNEPPSDYEEIKRNENILDKLAGPYITDHTGDKFDLPSQTKQMLENLYKELSKRRPTRVPSSTVPGSDKEPETSPETPTKSAVTPQQSAKPTIDVPADWRRFASVSPKHAEMAKAWIAATSGNRNVSEAALPFDDSSYKAFQKWYAATAKQLGQQFGPTKAIELIAQDSKKPKIASPEIARKMRAATADTTVVDKLPSARFNLTSELDSLNIELGKLMDEKPVVAKNFKNKKTSGLRLRKDIEAYEEMVQLSNRIKQVKKELESLEESVINESTYSRWQKLIKN